MGRVNLVNIVSDADCELLTVRVFYFLSIIYKMFRNPWFKDIPVCTIGIHKASMTVQLLGRVLLLSGIELPQLLILPDFLECIIRVKHR